MSWMSPIIDFEIGTMSFAEGVSRHAVYSTLLRNSYCSASN